MKRDLHTADFPVIGSGTETVPLQRRLKPAATTIPVKNIPSSLFYLERWFKILIPYIG